MKRRDNGERDAPEVHRTNAERLGKRDGPPQIEAWPAVRWEPSELPGQEKDKEGPTPLLKVPEGK